MSVFYLGGYHSEHGHSEKGEKGHKFEEHGGFKKGHKTKGGHQVHKLDEFEKKKKFFDEDGDSAYDEKHGSFHEESGYKKGGHKKHGSKKGGSHHDSYGKKKHYKKGHHSNDHKGHKDEKGMNKSSFELYTFFLSISFFQPSPDHLWNIQYNKQVWSKTNGTKLKCGHWLFFDYQLT